MGVVTDSPSIRIFSTGLGILSHQYIQSGYSLGEVHKIVLSMKKNLKKFKRKLSSSVNRYKEDDSREFEMDEVT